MIEQLLNREFLLAVAEGTRTGLDRALAERKSSRRRNPSALDEFSTEELKALSTDLAAVPDRPEKLRAAPRAGRRGPGRDEQRPDQVPPKDDYAFIPRNRMLSILQSAVEEVIEELQPDAIQEVQKAGGRRGSARAPAVTRRRLKDVELSHTSGKRRVWKRMEVAQGKWIFLSDPRWAYSKVCEIWRDHVRGYADFVDDPPVVKIENNARIFIVGDWGSGLERAQNVARRMREELAKGGDRRQVVIHLGDVYYSGTKREFERRFLKHWPVDKDTDIFSFTLPGNHDMYTGGHAYYGTALADPRFERQNGCSFFALETDHWQLLGLDSAYEDGGLHGRQAEWARGRIEQAPDTLKTTLLSHHQLFSAHEKGANKLQQKVQPVLETNRVDAWFWGHEHRCIQYEETEWAGHRVGFSSCVGHGGIPEYLVMKEGQTRPKPWVYEYLIEYDSGWQPWDMFGFAIVNLNDEHMSVRYIDENGTQHHSVPAVGPVPA